MFPLTGQSAQKGQVVYATSAGIFFQRGGDPAAHVGGIGPLISTTVFEGLVDMSTNIASLPRVAQVPGRSLRTGVMSILISRRGSSSTTAIPQTAEDVKFSFETHMRTELRIPWASPIVPGSRVSRSWDLSRSGSISKCRLRFVETPLVERGHHARKNTGNRSAMPRFCRQAYRFRAVQVGVHKTSL